MNRILKAIVVLLAVIAVSGLILVYGFRIRHVTVEGNDRYSAEEISGDLTSTNLLKNTLYFVWKYRSAVYSGDAPYLTSVRAKILSPTSVKVTVTESTLIGRVQYENQNVYFDDSGVVQEISSEVRENVPLVTGVGIEKPTLYQKLSVTNASTLRTMLSITQLLIQADFIPDSVSFDSSGNMTLRFGGIVVKLGQDEYLEEKIANLVAVYPQISSRTGTLNMEGFTGKNTSITFKEDGTGSGEDETEGDNTSGQTLVGVGTDTQEEEKTGEEADAEASGDGSTADGPSGDAQDASSGSQDASSDGQDASSGSQDASSDSQDASSDGQNEDQQDDSSGGTGVMAFDSSGNLHYDARIVNGQVVDGQGNPIDGCTVDENGNIKDAYWNVIDPATGALVQ